MGALTGDTHIRHHIKLRLLARRRSLRRLQALHEVANASMGVFQGAASAEWCVLSGSGLPKLHPGCLTVSCCCILEGDVPTIPSLETAPEASTYMRVVLT